MRQRHPVLLEVLTSAGFLGVVAVHGYLITHLGWPGFLVGLVSGFAWGLMFTFGVPSWLQTDLQVLRGHRRDELFASGEPSHACVLHASPESDAVTMADPEGNEFYINTSAV